MNKVVVGIVVALALLGAAVLFVVGQTDDKQTPTPTTSSQTTSQAANEADETPALQPAESDDATEIAATITYTDDGYSPNKLTVKKGDIVKLINNSSQPAQFSSDPHPSHTRNSELNQQTISPGSSQTFTVTRTGTYGFHDHINSRHEGTITVE